MTLAARPRTRKESGLKVTFKTNLRKYPTVVCTQESISKKITFNKPTDESPKTSTASESLKNFDKNPISTCKKRMNFKNEEGTSEKRSNKRTQTMNFLHPWPILPKAFKNQFLNIVGCLKSVVLVIEKGLSKTDIKKSQGRLFMPYSQVKNQFLKSSENQFLNSSEVDQLDSEKGKILTNLVQPCLEECQISSTNRKSNSMYALIGGWNEVCSRNALTQGMIIRLFSFKRNSALYFARVQID
ncbi:hypothetical protein Pfo_005107 [Paulownia fortunei]|nr:hypothetical protein Pfo_005107 [Paulownia fortunei]